MELAYIIFGALLVDWIIGDPQVAFHPVALIGKLALKLEKIARKLIKKDFPAGMLCTLIMTAGSAFLAYLLVRVCANISYAAEISAAVFCVFISIALKSLVIHSRAVRKPLENGDINKARKKIALIVSRDAEVLDEKEIIRSCLESVSENVIDGVTSAVFYAALGWYLSGPAGAAAAALFYRASNTLDATFGYKNERYAKFGTFPARLDDILNYIPARLTLAAIYAAAFLCELRPGDAVRCAWRDHAKHPSPNSCWSMAAFAGALGVRLGGPTCYKGKWKQYPYWGVRLHDLNIKHIEQANRLAVATALLFSLLMLVVTI